jgi:hypothetical protein
VCCVHEIAQPRANASKGNDLTKVSLKQYEELRDLWPPHWLGVLPQYVADALKAPAKFREAPKEPVVPMTKKITCTHLYTLKWRRDVCAHFGLTPSLI